MIHGTNLIRPYTISVGQPVLDDLKSRLRNTRWPDKIKGSTWGYGADLEYMKELVDYWQNDFDWRKTESVVNQHENFLARIEG